MPRWVKWLLGVVAALVLLVVAAAAALPRSWSTLRGSRPTSPPARAQALGRPVQVQRGLDPRAAAAGHRAARSRGRRGPEVRHRAVPQARRGLIRLQLLPLLTGRVELGDIVLRKPAVTIIQAADGRLNIASLGSTAEPRSRRPAGESASGGVERRPSAGGWRPGSHGRRHGDLRRPRQGRAGRAVPARGPRPDAHRRWHPDHVQGRRAPAAGRRGRLTVSDGVVVAHPRQAR